jgi:hypothetical protein
MMKKILCLLLTICLILTLVGCGDSYSEATYKGDEMFANGYFTIIKEWGSTSDTIYRLMYANDTKVIYFYMNSGYGKDITPMYNADGTLQIYE